MIDTSIRILEHLRILRSRGLLFKIKVSTLTS